MLSMTSVNLRYRRIHKATKAAVVSTIRPLQQHQYTLFDLQYVFLFVLFSFCYYIMDKPIWFKLPIALFASGLLIPKKTRQFMLPFLAIAAWLILFYCCRFIPAEWRPHIFTSVLPALENILYGGNISELLATTPSAVKDLLAWMPYGVLHFVLPFVTAALIVFFGPPGTLPVFARTFGYMNLAGVLTQLFFPCAPPWYETHYGALEPATYNMPGDPGGLARVDDILGTNMYKSTFTASPMVFGAFPSLHSACAWQLAFFLVFIFGPRSIPFVVAYVFWIWWATMYLGHHYVVDLVGGAGYAVVAFWIGSFFLPSVLPTDHNAKATHVIHDLGDAMNHQEKQTLFDAAHEDFVGFKNNSKEWAYDDDEEEESVEEMSKVVVVTVETEIEEERTLVPSEPSSPTGSTHSDGRATSHGWSRDSMHSTTSSVVTLNLDLEANAAAVQGSSPSKRDSFIMSASSLSTIEEAGSSSSSPKGRARPSRLILEKAIGSPIRSLPSSPLVDQFVAELDGVEVSSPSSSRPTSPRSFVSGSPSPLSKRFKDD
ncbi:Aureobasidin resistance protein Aur1 [Podila horticola]|nr:Aureobasidin resistance protein Aur1 [Podila horticola]